MIDQFALSEARVAIIGLGLMGGSLAAALKGHCKQVIGIDKDAKAVEYALKYNYVDHASTGFDNNFLSANVIVFAVPVRIILQMIPQLPMLHPESAVVLDIGSTKKEVVTALQNLPEQFDPVGTHPMCGKEKLTITNANPAMYQNAPFAITPLDRTTNTALTIAGEIAKTIGAKHFFVKAETHDRWTAAASHSPYLLSLALALSTPEDVSPLVGPGFKSTVRLAGTPKSMMLDILETNREEVLKQCQAYMDSLAELTALIETKDFEKLAELMETGKAQKKFFTAERKV